MRMLISVFLSLLSLSVLGMQSSFAQDTAEMKRVFLSSMKIGPVRVPVTSHASVSVPSGMGYVPLSSVLGILEKKQTDDIIAILEELPSGSEVGFLTSLMQTKDSAALVVVSYLPTGYVQKELLNARLSSAIPQSFSQILKMQSIRTIQPLSYDDSSKTLSGGYSTSTGFMSGKVNVSLKARFGKSGILLTIVVVPAKGGISENDAKDLLDIAYILDDYRYENFDPATDTVFLPPNKFNAPASSINELPISADHSLSDSSVTQRSTTQTMLYIALAFLALALIVIGIRMIKQS